MPAEVPSPVEPASVATTFEMSCYTDPLGIESVTGLLAAAISHVGAGEFGSDIR